MSFFQPSGEGASQVGTTTAGAAFFAGSKFYTHCASGHYWIAYDDGNTGILSSSPDGVTWTSQGSIFSFAPDSSSNRWAARFQGNVVIAIANHNSSDTHYYRKGTLNPDGTVSWNGTNTAIGPADPVWPETNSLIANGKPIHWRADLLGAGTFWIGSQLDGPTWTKTATNAPDLAPTTAGGDAAGAILAVGGPDPNDLIVLRATTSDTATAGSHRLVSVKYDASADSYDASWYNVSTLGGTLTEDDTTLVRNGGIFTHPKRFSAVKDSLGNVHAVYINRDNNVAHYKKDAGFNDSWSRVTSDATEASTSIDRVGLTAAGSGNLILFYSKTDARIYYRRFDGTSWGSEATVKSDTTTLEDALAPLEIAESCGAGIAWIEGAASPWDIKFALLDDHCSELRLTEGAGSYTVTAPLSFEMRFNEATGGGIDVFYDLAEDSSRTYDLAGGTGGVKTLFHASIRNGGIFYSNSTNDRGARIDVLEATATRVKLRQNAFFQDPAGTAILGGVRGTGDYSIYGSGKVALRWNVSTTLPVSYDDQPLELGVHWSSTGGDPLNSWAPYHQGGNAFPEGTGTSDFVMLKSDVLGVRTDFLSVFYRDWTGPPFLEDADGSEFATSPTDEWAFVNWRHVGATSFPAGASQSWNRLTYFKPTDLEDHLDPDVTGRSADYRNPDALNVTVGTGWNENPADGDFFNESEGAYTLDLDPSSGLAIGMDGASATRFQPFVKIRQWRSLADPPTVTLDSAALVNELDFRADVKPVSRAHFASDLIWYSTMQDSTEVATPHVGTGGTVTNADFVAGRYGGAVRFDAGGEFISFSPSGNFDFAQGTVEFWYQPDYDNMDDSAHRLWGYSFDSTHFFTFQKENSTGSNNLRFDMINGAGVQTAVRIEPTEYSWRAGDWVHLRVTWDEAGSGGNKARIFVNGVEPPHFHPSSSYTSAGMPATGTLLIGADSGGTRSAQGLIDEFRIYSTAITPAALARGGLASDPAEFLNDISKNFTLDFSAVDGSLRGEYFYLGADAKFRGLNVSLATAGFGNPNLEWQHWNGTSWDDLESVGGFTDETSDLTSKNGTIYWTSDPPGWSPYSVNGGPDLYYVRAYLASGSYTTSPVESVIKTDVLLFQYCGDVTLNQTFVFAVPVPTAVELVSLEAVGLDGAVELSWETGSELMNLGFHVYRAVSVEGPYERLTSRVIPGLGSSPAGARYRYTDGSLRNGTTYHYQLEDVESTGRTERHGPVSATPQPGAAPGPEEEPAPARIAYGEPESTRLSVIRLSEREVILELRTGGFRAEAQDDGTVRIEVPGFEETHDLPVRRSWVPAVPGRRVTLAEARASELVSFSGWKPSALGSAEMEARADGTVRARRRPRREAPSSAERPERPWARLLSVGFQGERKKAWIELSPLRWNDAEGGLILARRLVVRVVFAGTEPGEAILDGGKGRAPRATSRRRDGVVARLLTDDPGFYFVSYEEIFGRRARPGDGSRMRLSRQGDPVAFHRDSRGIYFVSEGSRANPYGPRAVYEMELGEAGLTMPTVSVRETAARTEFYWNAIEREENRWYQAGLLEAEDLWFWEVLLAPATASIPFDVSAPSASGGPAELEVFLQGASDDPASPDHHVRVFVNGTLVGESSFEGKSPHGMAMELLPGILREGTNRLEIENVGDTSARYSMVFLDRFRVVHPRELRAEGGMLRGAWSASGVAEIAEVRPGGSVLDVTGEIPRWVVPLAGERLRFSADAGRSYLVVSEAALRRPEIRRSAAGRLSQRGLGADYLVVGPRELLPAAGPLLELRRSQGLRARPVAVEDVFEEFGHGEARPEAIREFLAFAFHHWEPPAPRYVVLLGDATYDFKDWLGTGVPNRVPPLMIRTSYLWTASDPGYASVNGEDLLPDLAIGRLPATDLEEARGMVAKIVAYETGAGISAAPIVLVADDADRAGDFPRDLEDLAASLLAGKRVRRIHLSELGVASARAAIAGAFDEGAALMSYAGHGGIHLWAGENLLHTGQVADLAPQPQQPLLLTMNCLNGYFHFPYFDSLAEELVKAEGRGAIAAFSPSGLSLNGPAHVYHRALLAELFHGSHSRLGDAVLAAQAVYAESGAFPELLQIYHLFGDPALRLRP